MGLAGRKQANRKGGVWRMVGSAAVWPAFGRLFFQAYMEALLDWPYAILIIALLMIHWKIYKEPVQAGLLSFFVLLLSLPAGLLGSLLLVLAGIRAEALPAGYMLALTMVLALAQPRFICLAYSGSLLCFSSLLFGWPALEVPQVMGLVAILHLVESLLVALSSSRGARPALTPGLAGPGDVGSSAWRKHYDLLRLWPLPMVAVTAAFMPQGQLPPGLAEMPDWWPLLDSGAKALSLEAQAQGRSLIFALSPFVAMLGYSQRFTTERVYFGKSRRPQGKTKLPSADRGDDTLAAAAGGGARVRESGKAIRPSGKGAGVRGEGAATIHKGLRHSAFSLLIYSLILFALSWLAAQPPATLRQSLRYLLEALPPLWGILGHEWIAGSFRERKI